MAAKPFAGLTTEDASRGAMSLDTAVPNRGSSVPQTSNLLLSFLVRVSACVLVALMLVGAPECGFGFATAAKKKDKGTGSPQNPEYDMRSLATAKKKDTKARSSQKEEKQPTAEELAIVEDSIVRLTNAVRKRKGLSPVKSSRPLVFLARHHSRDMCRTGTFQHESDAFPKGWRRFWERMKLAGLRDGGENIAFRTWMPDRKKWAVAVVKGWIHSPPHLKNILDPAFRYVGIGVVSCSRNIGYVTQVFSTGQGRLPNVKQNQLVPGRGTSPTAILTR